MIKLGISIGLRATLSVGWESEINRVEVILILSLLSLSTAISTESNTSLGVAASVAVSLDISEDLSVAVSLDLSVDLSVHLAVYSLPRSLRPSLGVAVSVAVSLDHSTDLSADSNLYQVSLNPLSVAFGFIVSTCRSISCVSGISLFSVLVAMKPGSQYPGYVDFLHSVSGNNAQGNFPYESFPYSLNIRASQIPPFSSQQNEAPSQPDNPPVETPSGGERRKTGEDGSQPSSNNVGEEELRPEGIKAAKARRNSRKGMAVEDFKSVHELKMEDLAKKERLSNLAILDTLLAKKEPTEREENAMGLDYSYTQPSKSEDCGLGGSADSGNIYSLSFVGYKETELRELKEVQFDVEQKLVRLESIVCDLGRKKSRFELVVGVLVFVLVIIAIGVAARM
ncbi:hypothetical protein YC2023_070566 [Brassica napus]